MFKKAIGMFLAFSIVVTFIFGSACYASSNASLDQKLLKMGVPEKLLTTMGDAQKKDIIKNCTKFIGYQEVTSSFNEPSTTDGEISIMGTIPSDKLYQNIQVYSSGTSSDNRERYSIYHNFDWFSMPTFRWTDPFGVSWSNNWRAVPNTSQLYTYAQNSRGSIINWENETALAYAASNGCGWNADVPNQDEYGQSYVDYWGYGKIQIESMTTGSVSGSDQLCANYAHVYGLGSIGLTFGPVFVSYSGSASSDTQGIYATFSY